MIKRCVRCGKEINVRQSNYKYCTECRPIVKRERNAAYLALWRKRNREKFLKYTREAMRKYREQHIEHYREYDRKYREEQKRKLIREILSATGVKPK